MKAWHFLNDDSSLQWKCGRIKYPKVGQTLTVDPDKLALCKYGLHASIEPLDALQHAPGAVICRVNVGGRIVCDYDKLVAAERTIIAMTDATETLRKFARICALDVIHLWNAPDIVVQYLKTGDETLRDAARAATRAAAQAATRAATLDAARAATRDAAWAATWAASRAASRAATWAATRAAALAAARDAALDASRAATRAASWDAALDASWDAQNRRLTRMLNKSLREDEG